MPPKATSFTQLGRLSRARAKEYSLQDVFKYGYRNKEDVSNLPANTLVVGSQNVLTNAAEQVVIRNGYTLDGSAGNQNTYGIDSNYDFNTRINGIQNTRKWGTNLECRYVNPNTNIVSWINIYSTLSATNVINACDYWEGTKSAMLFVNGNLNVYRWTGGVGSYLSSTSNSITVQGTKSLTNLNFDQSGFLTIDGVQYSYTSAGLTTTQAYTQNPTNTTATIDNTHYVSQLFTTGVAAVSITTVTLELVITNSSSVMPGLPIVSAYLLTNNAGVPGTLISGAVASPSSNVTGSYSLTFTFNTAVSAGTVYHLAFNTIWPVTNGGSYTIATNIGASGSVGTNIGTSTTIDSGLPPSWSASNGYLYMTVNENDAGGTTFNGVTPTPSGMSVGDAIIQTPQIGATSINGAPLPTFDLIAQLGNQIYYGSFTYNVVYMSRQGNYTDCTFTAIRKPFEGGNGTIDAPPTAFKAQATDMYISSGRSGWWKTVFTLSADTTTQAFQINPLQTATNQGAQSQALVGKLKNSIVFVSNETIVNAFGPVKDILGSPNFVNMSDPIKYDIDAYNFTGGQMYYYNYFVYITIPQMGVVRLYNVNKKYWEAPQVLPVSRFYEVNGVLYGHSSLTNESYQMFTGYNDNGNPINSVIAFPYVSQEGGAAQEKKNFNKIYTEGYIAANTTLMLTINYDFGGFTGTYTTIISGQPANGKQTLFNKITDGSLGQNSLGNQPIGTILNLPNTPAIPKFRIINTMPRLNFYEYQLVYSTDDIDFNYALLRFGPAVSADDALPSEITI